MGDDRDTVLENLAKGVTRPDVLARTGPLIDGLTRVPVGERTYRKVMQGRDADPLEAKAKAALAKGAGTMERDDTAHSNVLPSNDDVHTLFTMSGALFPPYDPEILVTLYEHSNCLRSNVDAYATNIDAFGYRLEPVIDPKSAKANEQIGDAIYLERLRTQERAAAAAVQQPSDAAAPVLAAPPQASYPSPEEIEARKKEIVQLMRLERSRLDNFFEHCCAETSFTELRERTRVDHEVTGNAYWEVLRNGYGEVTQFVYVPGYSVRLIPIEHKHHEYTVNQKISDLSYEPVVMRRRFRRYVQVVLDRIVHFKEFGDPRVVSRKTGKAYPSVKDLQNEDPHDGPATELIHFRVHSPRSPYGIPRWIGNLLAVLGSRASEEVNFLYFDNKAVPPLAVLVSGGKLAEASVKRLESFVKDNLRGKENFHRILVMEAETGPSQGLTENGRVRITLEPLRDAQQQDALFQEYDERNIDKVGGSFRLPRLLRGDVRDFNRATADAALQFAEMQVFQPEREKFDAIINRRIMSELGIRFWRFVSRSPVNRDPLQVAQMAKLFSDCNALVPAELRDLAEEVFNREFKEIPDAWAHEPFQLTLAGIMPAEDVMGPAHTTALTGPQGEPADPHATPPAPAPTKRALSTDEQRLQAIANGLVRLRNKLETAKAESWDRSVKGWLAEASADPSSTVTIRMSKAQLEEILAP